MREILFRGKCLYNGKWYEGADVMHKTVRGELCLANVGEDWIAVIPETFGEYTGLTDKNGVKIFVGDILKHDSGTIHEVVFEQRNGKAYFGWVISEIETWHFDTEFLHQLQVIGNVHDNPELLNTGGQSA